MGATSSVWLASHLPPSPQKRLPRLMRSRIRDVAKSTILGHGNFGRATPILDYFRKSNIHYSTTFGRVTPLILDFVRTSSTSTRLHTATLWFFAHLNSIKSPALVLVPHTVGFLPTCVTFSSPGLVIDDGDAGAVLSSAACCFFRLSASAFLSACQHIEPRPAFYCSIEKRCGIYNPAT